MTVQLSIASHYQIAILASLKGIIKIFFLNVLINYKSCFLGGRNINSTQQEDRNSTRCHSKQHLHKIMTTPRREVAALLLFSPRHY